MLRTPQASLARVSFTGHVQAGKHSTYLLHAPPSVCGVGFVEYVKPVCLVLSVRLRDPSAHVRAYYVSVAPKTMDVLADRCVCDDSPNPPAHSIMNIQSVHFNSTPFVRWESGRVILRPGYRSHHNSA